MPINPAGTKPGLAPKANEPPKLAMKCRNEACDSMYVIEIAPHGSAGHRRLYQCVKCRRTFGVGTGGNIDI